MINEEETISKFHTQCSPLARKYRILILLLIVTIIVILLILCIVFGILWTRSKSNKDDLHLPSESAKWIGSSVKYPNNEEYIQWTFLQLNDVYEIFGLDEGKKGGLARVGTIRQILIDENPQTWTILSGDFLSPSALSQSNVDGQLLNGRQMISVLNQLGIDFVTFGNHEFDLNQEQLETRMNESTFLWISSNVYRSGTNQTFFHSIPYKVLRIDQIDLLFIGLTIDVKKSYVDIVNQTSLSSFVKEFLRSISHVHYDILIALTHLDLPIDIQLLELIPEIDLILGGHEHENIFLSRGSKMSKLSKADGNAFTVFIHRCAFHLKTKKLRIHSHLTSINEEIPEEFHLQQLVKNWTNLAFRSFEQIGFQPNQTISCLPSNIQLDGKSSSVRNFPTVLTNDACQSLLESTATQNTTIALYNTGSIRIDDVLKDKITQYDVLRIFPFQDYLYSFTISGIDLQPILSRGYRSKGKGDFISFCGIETSDQGQTWLANGIDITSSSSFRYRIATIEYFKTAEFNSSTITDSHRINRTQTQSFIHYLQKKYPLC